MFTLRTTSYDIVRQGIQRCRTVSCAVWTPLYSEKCLPSRLGRRIKKGISVFQRRTHYGRHILHSGAASVRLDSILCSSSDVTRWRHEFVCGSMMDDSEQRQYSVASHRRLSTGWPEKQQAANFCPYRRQILTDFPIFFTGRFCGKFVINWWLNIPPHLNCVSTIPCEIYIFKNHYNHNKYVCKNLCYKTTFFTNFFICLVLDTLPVFVYIRIQYCRTEWAKKLSSRILFIYSPNIDEFYRYIFHKVV